MLYYLSVCYRISHLSHVRLKRRIGRQGELCMIELLAALSISAAAGMRVALPLLLIVLIYSDRLWAELPLISLIPQSVALGILVSWSIAELLFSKNPASHRFVQTSQLIFGPVVGAIAGIGVARVTGIAEWLIPLIGLIGGLLALILQLVQVGWFYRLRSIPLWVVFAQDFLCVSLVLFAFDAPQQGGLVALLLLWLAIRSSKEWQRWYRGQAKPEHCRSPRRGKINPD